MAEIYDYDVSAANNNSAPPDGFPENMQYSEVNNAAREVMAVIARYMQALGAITTTGTGNAYDLTLNQAGTLAKGRHFMFQADRANTGAPTLNINAGGAVALVDSGGVALVSGAIAANGIYHVMHDGTNFRVIGSESAANLKAKYESNADTNAFTDADHTKLDGIESGATADQTAGEIKTSYESNADTNAFTDADHSKLDGIESGATADQTDAEIRTAVENASDSNVFTDADHTKLNGIESGATADQSNSEIKTAYEANADTNAFTDAEQTKLGDLNIYRAAASADMNNINVAAPLVNDDDLFFTSLPIGKYYLAASIAFRQNGGSEDFSFDFAATVGTMTGNINAACNITSPSGTNLLTGNYSRATTLGSLLIVPFGSGTDSNIHILNCHGVVDVTVAGTLRFRFAKGSSGGTGVDRLANSSLLLIKMD